MSCELNILQNIDNGSVFFEPFPYLIINNALPQELYKELSSNYPSNEIIAGDDLLKNNIRYQLSVETTIENLHVSQIWKDFVFYHTSKEFYIEVLNVFGEELDKYYSHLGNLYSKNTHWRKKNTKTFPHQKIALDCQIGINSPVFKKSSVINAHLDNPVELYAGLFYLREPEDNGGGHLIIYRQKDKTKRYPHKVEIPNYELEIENIVEYQPNTFVLMMCTPQSIHGVSPREVTNYSRRLVNIIAESSDDLSSVK